MPVNPIFRDRSSAASSSSNQNTGVTLAQPPSSASKRSSFMPATAVVQLPERAPTNETAPLSDKILAQEMEDAWKLAATNAAINVLAQTRFPPLPKLYDLVLEALVERQRRGLPIGEGLRSLSFDSPCSPAELDAVRVIKAVMVLEKDALGGQVGIVSSPAWRLPKQGGGLERTEKTDSLERAVWDEVDLQERSR